MGILDNLAGMLGGRAGAQTTERAGPGGLGGMISSGALGPLARTVLTNKNGDFSWIKGALMAGAGTMLWKKLSERVQQQNAAVDPQYGKIQSTPREQAERVIRALVYAAKSDGHIDDEEKNRINAQVRLLNIGNEGEDLVRQAMNEPLDPSLIANGVKDPQEALQLYTLSAAVIDSDSFMEKTYLDGLAQALGIPSDVKTQVEDQVRSGKAGVR